jgi:hypothetical protein
MTDCTPYPRPVSSRKSRKFSKEEVKARMAWKTDGRVPGCDPHHVIDAQVLRHMGFSDYLWDPRNKLWVAREIHAGHTSRMRPLTFDWLTEQNLEFAAELDMKLGRAYFIGWLYKHYPKREAEAA